MSIVERNLSARKIFVLMSKTFHLLSLHFQSFGIVFSRRFSLLQINQFECFLSINYKKFLLRELFCSHNCNAVTDFYLTFVNFASYFYVHRQREPPMALRIIGILLLLTLCSHIFHFKLQKLRQKWNESLKTENWRSCSFHWLTLAIRKIEYEIVLIIYLFLYTILCKTFSHKKSCTVPARA